MPYNFAVIGCGGYIAPRHLKAIKETGNNLVAAVDPKDSVGILDQFGYDVAYFTEIERFDRHIEKLRRVGKSNMVDWISVCSPNYLHDAHIRMALRAGANVICEKPLVINPWNLDALQELEEETGQRVYTVLQLRLSPVLVQLKQDLAKSTVKRHSVDLTYITPRGLWYGVSWKGDNEKSGGLPINIGIHLFDMLIWLFGGVKDVMVHYRWDNKISGYLELEKADVSWSLSIDPKGLPPGKTSQRSIIVDEVETDFSGGFTDLHTRVYRETLDGHGFGINDARPSVELAYKIRNW